METSKPISIIEQDANGIFIVHEKFERNYDTHYHLKGQLSYVEDGIAYVTIKNQQFIVPARYFIWIPKNVPHKLKVSHSATQLHSIYFPEFLDVTNDFHNEFGIYPATDLIIAIIRFSEKWNKKSVNKTMEYFELIKSLYQIIAEKKESRLALQLPFSENEQVIKVTLFIQGNYDKNLSLEVMTEKFNMSERTFTRWFKKELGISFVQYLKSVRILNAIELLLKTNLSIAEISNHVGYDSLSSFSNLFFTFTGKRPNEMRRYFEQP